MSGARLEPLFGLRLRTERLELRLPTDDELVGLARLAEQGIHEPEEMPFRVAWTDGIGSPAFFRDFAAFHRQAREEWRPEHWRLLLGVWAGGEAIGTQAIEAEGFAGSRTVESGSWLGRRFQALGYGTEMRAAVLELAFAGLGARAAISGAFEDNVASFRVSEKLGYVRVGEAWFEPRGVPQRERVLRLEREVWERRERPRVEIAGLEPCLPALGL